MIVGTWLRIVKRKMAGKKSLHISGANTGTMLVFRSNQCKPYYIWGKINRMLLDNPFKNLLGRAH
ncbi:hypothetical protein P872_08580 [Rhodonellum psychrophilum GCM71 = DSM 17998]|uniref:Uncharacterized protein n=1 Tax=Rhodonellum psychrophilum GCM71 = DSM 17998 TaxID=1123057 RepID=U5BWT0_9BACT|nr:hypothetical protein P872_08580 [Rhodonellum psychrophilum GCM71 = DSM 17998]